MGSRNITGLKILIALIGIIAMFIVNVPINPPTLLAKKIYTDLTEAKKNKEVFPDVFNSLAKIKIETHTEHADLKKRILQCIYLPFQTDPTGKNYLMIDAIENFAPPEEAILILQFSLFDKNSKNKIWETSRVYHLSPEELAEVTASSL